MSQSVQIVNSVRGSGYTSAKNAARFVARGMAIWDGKAIRMIETDYRFNSHAVPVKAVIHAPVLPEVIALPFVECWRTTEAAVAWPWVESPGFTARVDTLGSTL